MAKKDKGLKGHNANYDCKQHAPTKPMGHGSFANLPVEPMHMKLSGKWNMRDGIPNSPITSINMISGVDENMAEQMVMIRPAGKATNIAKNVLKNKGVKVQSGIKMKKKFSKTPHLQH